MTMRGNPAIHYILVAAMVALPGCLHAQVVVSEIAWMGTAEDANNEWIELHNRGADAVDVSGWTLGDGDALLITLAGTIEPDAFALLERSDDGSVPSVAAFQTYTGALANSGKTLTLRDAGSTKIDDVVGGDEWSLIGGDNGTKDTPQRTAALEWISGTPTPGARNAATSSAVVDESTTTVSTPTQSTGRRSGAVVRRREAAPQERTAPAELALTLSAPQIAYVNQPVAFVMEPSGPGNTILHSLTYAWNFGDTYTGAGKNPTHTFAYPGEYVVVVEATYKKRIARARHEIRVLPVSFALSRGPGGEVMVKNLSAHETDIGGFTLQGNTSFVFPRYTILKAGASLTIPPQRTGSARGAVALVDAVRTPVATLAQQRTRAAPVALVPQETASARVTAPAPSTQADSSETRTNNPTVIRIGGAREGAGDGVVDRIFARITELFRF